MKRLLFVLLAVGCIGISVPTAQMRVTPIDELEGHAALGLSLRHLGNAGIFMMATAHPDDENNGLLVMLNRGQGYRTTLRHRDAAATAARTRSAPRSSRRSACCAPRNCAALHRFDGAEQYFTRAVDFGFSFSVEETFEKWGHDEIARRLRAHDPHDPSRRHHRSQPDRRRRRPAPPGVGVAWRARPS